MNLHWSSVSGPVLVSNYCAMAGMRLVNTYWSAIEGDSVVFCNWPCNGPLWISQSLYETGKSTHVRQHYAIDGPLLVFSNSVVFCNRPCSGHSLYETGKSTLVRQQYAIDGPLLVFSNSVVFCNRPSNDHLLYKTGKSTLVSLVRQHYATVRPLLVFSNSVVFCNGPCSGPLFVWNQQIHSGDGPLLVFSNRPCSSLPLVGILVFMSSKLPECGQNTGDFNFVQTYQ